MEADDVAVCDDCGADATHILVDYRHRLIPRADGSAIFYCKNHAFADGRESCRICEGFGASLTEYDGVEYHPTYAAGEIDEQGCCNEHP